MPTLAELFKQTVRHHQNGQLGLAENLCRQILQADPRHGHAWHLLGIIAGQVGRPELAVEYIRHALRFIPDFASAHNNLGNVLHDQGKLEEAAASFRAALRLQPDVAQGHFNLGNVLRDQGKLMEAEASYSQALRLRPNYPEAHNNLGNVLRDEGKLAEAETNYRQALRLEPGYAEAHNNLGNVLCDQGKLEEAEASCHQAVRLQPGFAGAHLNLGDALRAQGKLEEAAACCREALRLQPGYAEAHNNLGVVLQEMGRLEEPEACYREAVRLKPSYTEAHNNLGIVLLLQGKLDEAEACYSEALRLQPGYAEAHCSLGKVLRDQGKLKEAEACFSEALRLKPHFREAHSNLLLSLILSPHHDTRSVLEEHQRWHQQHAQPLARSKEPHTNDRTLQRRLRIGYISPNFRDHVVGRNILPLVRQHDSQQFEITLYAHLAAVDGMTVQFQKLAHRWRNATGWSDSQLADKIKEDSIDILVDLALHTSGNRLLALARKPAPVQVTFAGYPGTTGMSAIDYRLSDPYLDPPGMFDACYAEETYRLPHSFWCYDPQTIEPAVAALPALVNGYVTFGCLNNFCKLNVPTLVLWAKVLRSLPSSRLILLSPEGRHRQRVLGVLEAENIDAGRITFVAQQPRPRYLEQYGRIDIALDTLPYNGHTTSLDAYWMGVPVVTLVGQTVVGRAGFSQLSNLDLRDLAALTEDDFVSIVVSLAQDLPRLSQLRAGLRTRMQSSPLMDLPQFARGIEAAYHHMWQRWCKDEF